MEQQKFDTQLARSIDHTLLKAEATPEQVKKLCSEARQYEFASVCVNSTFVPLCKAELTGSPVKVCTVVGFPLGACSTAAKVAETEWAIRNGAQEVDMVIHIGSLKSGNVEAVEKDIAAVAQAAHSLGAIVKVIIETGLLTQEEKVAACLAAKRAKADFVKTSTGFSVGGATVEDIALMRKTVGPEMGVKASGGVKTTELAKAMIQNGATRIGTSSGVALVTGATAGTSY